MLWNLTLAKFRIRFNWSFNESCKFETPLHYFWCWPFFLPQTTLPPTILVQKGGIFYGTTNPKIRFVTEKLKSDFTRLSDCGASGGGVPNLPRTCPCMEDPTIIYYMKSRRSYASSFPHNFRLKKSSGETKPARMTFSK